MLVSLWGAGVGVEIGAGICFMCWTGVGAGVGVGVGVVFVIVVVVRVVVVRVVVWFVVCFYLLTWCSCLLSMLSLVLLSLLFLLSSMFLLFSLLLFAGVLQFIVIVLVLFVIVVLVVVVVVLVALVFVVGIIGGKLHPGNTSNLSVSGSVQRYKQPRRCNTQSATHSCNQTIWEPSRAVKKRSTAKLCQIPRLIGWIRVCCLQTVYRANHNSNKHYTRLRIFGCQGWLVVGRTMPILTNTIGLIVSYYKLQGSGRDMSTQVAHRDETMTFQCQSCMPSASTPCTLWPRRKVPCPAKKPALPESS